MPYIGRLAPSPTGFLHLGHARTFHIAHQRARAANGLLYLRNEDLDPHRSRPEFVTAMREDLLWLGITWDRDLSQSDRLPLYRAALTQLLHLGLAYPCTCSRKDLARSISAPHEETPALPDDDEPVYNNRCRPTSPPDSTAIPPHTNYRFRIPTPDPITFTDLHAGPQSFTPGLHFGDFLIWRKALSPGDKDGLPSYQLACAVDDALTHITEVVRGRDLLKSTARQILLQRALGYPTPSYFHTDLLRDAASGLRLAKRHDALSLRSLRAQGLSPTDVLAMF
jgi:glutamyl-tRNA synthetase